MLRYVASSAAVCLDGGEGLVGVSVMIAFPGADAFVRMATGSIG